MFAAEIFPFSGLDNMTHFKCCGCKILFSSVQSRTVPMNVHKHVLMSRGSTQSFCATVVVPLSLFSSKTG